MSTPKSNIYLLSRGNNLTADQHHTYWFSNADNQRAFFLTNGTYLTIPNTQYIRVNNNSLKVPLAKYEIDGNYAYMAIEAVQYFSYHQGGGTSQNPHKKMWYAFITNTEYVSDSCTLITFKIDVLQTFLFSGNVNLADGMVARCHERTDEIGENRVAEPFSFIPTEISDIEWYPIDIETVLGVVSDAAFSSPTYGINYTAIGTQYYQKSSLAEGQYLGINTGAQYFRFRPDPLDQNCLKEILDSLKTDPNNVLDLYICPKDALPARASDDNTPSLSTMYIQLSAPTAKDFTCSLVPNDNVTFEGYEPHNKKLYTSPFTELHVTTTTGESMALKFEDFAIDEQVHYRRPKFKIQGSWLDQPSLMIVPRYYNGSKDKGNTGNMKYSGNTEGENYDYTLFLNKFPKCGWNYDVYKQWQAQKSLAESYLASTRLGVSLAGGTVKSAGRALSRTIAGFNPTTTLAYATEDLITTGSNALEGALLDIAKITAEQMELESKPEYTVQQATNDGLLPLAHNHNHFEFQRVSIKRYQAEMVDAFFDQFGYAQNKIMDIGGWLSAGDIRPYYKYIKTTSLHVNGNCPAVYKEEIASIFDRGITFWGTSSHPSSEVTICDYSVNNTV